MAKGKKTGGRQKGTPNKENPLKGYIRAHSLKYFEPRKQVDENGNPRVVNIMIGDTAEKLVLADANGLPLVMSNHDVDMLILSPENRVNAELRLLEFHTPKMKAVDVDMNMRGTVLTIENRLRELCGETDDEE